MYMKKSRLFTLFAAASLMAAPGLALGHGTDGGGGGSTHPVINLPATAVTFYADGGVESFFEIQLSGVPSGFDVQNSTYAGWCVDYYDVESPTGAFYQGQLHSTVDVLPSHLQSPNWDMVNYILNHKAGSRDDIQNAIWFFTDGLNVGLSAAAQALINAALANGEGFVPGVGQSVAVVIDQEGPLLVQRPIIEVPRPQHEEPPGGGGGGNPPPECRDRVTGGGWIRLSSGAKGTFSVQGGYQNGTLWGGLNYIDHGTKMHVKSRTPTSYTVVTAVCRRMTYDATINGQPGVATVKVCDNGEPGRDDIFEISLSNGYTAGGDLGGTQPGGGNIQLHKCKVSHKKTR